MHQIRLRAAFTLGMLGAAAFGAPAHAGADVVTAWGARAVAVGAEKPMTSARFARAMAMVHVAMFEAVNAIDRRYKPYRLELDGDARASKDAAASAAAHAVLLGLFPDEQPKLDPALAASLATLADGDAKTRGVELGKRAAAGIVALRANDGSNAPESYRPLTQPGLYVPTMLPADITTGNMAPWVMAKGSQFRPAPPPALDSAAWTRDVNELQALGGLRSKTRTAGQTEIGRFWFLTGPRTFMPLVQQVVEARKMDVVDGARLYALVTMAASDALIAVFDAKYAYNFWRPITAIRNADLASNPATTRDPSWVPLGPTPMHPEYPCAHCIVAAAVAEVLEAVAGPDVGELSLTSALSPGVTRRWTRLADYNEEVSEARIYAGFHYRFSTDVGKAMGKRIGELAVTTQMTGPGAPTR